MAKKILVVDDDPVIIRLLESKLTANGYEVMFSQEATQGLEMAVKKAPDLVILDVMMPIVNGYNFCRLLKSQEKLKNIPVMMLTSRSEEADKRIGQEVGADAYLTKPLNVDEFLTMVATLLT